MSDTDPLRARIRAAARQRLRIDPRSLAALRAAVGVLLVADLLLRARWLTAFYTDAGVYPRAARVAAAGPYEWSLHLAAGDAWAQGVLFAVAGLLGAALALGYRTRAATVGSWVLLVSLHNRAPGVLNGGDVLLRLLLFWGLFLPLGARWSVDAFHRREAGAAGTAETAGTARTAGMTGAVGGVAAAALLLQVVLMYATNAAFKLAGDLWLRGQGLEYVFSLGQFTVLLGDYLAAFPLLLTALDYLWLALVTGSFLLVVLPGWWRAGLVALFAAMHLGMALTMQLGLFPLIAVAALLAFVPGVAWDRAERLWAGTEVRGPLRDAARSVAAGLPAVRVSGVPPRLRRVRDWTTTVVPLAFLVLVVLWNVQFLGYHQVAGHDTVPEPAEAAVEVAGVDQYWSMFAPGPMRTDGWIVAPGRLANGTRVDAFRGGPVVRDRPADVSDTYPTARWRKYLVGLWDDGRDAGAFAAYLCGRWDRRHDSTLRNVSVYFVAQPTRLEGREPTDRQRLAVHRCRTP